MMHAVALSQLTLSMESGVVVQWLVADGDDVAAGDPIVEIETDKAVQEVESPVAGTLRRLAEEGAELAVGAVLAQIDDGTDPDVSAAADVAAPDDQASSTPAARRIARDRGVDLIAVAGTGPGGRITADDVERSSTAAPRNLRDAVVGNIAASWRDIPHIQITGELDASMLVDTRATASFDATLTDYFIASVASALLEVPELNGSNGQPASCIHVAIAVATPDGVVSPVVRNAAELTIVDITHERVRIVTAARAGALDPRDLAGGTVTLTNLGQYPVDFFSPVISGPQIATVAIGRVIERPAVIGGVIQSRPSVWATVAIDHRAADGEAGGRFLAALQSSMNDLST